jgi:NAD(P)-dependent dehydrogenase (short-subunit alcohol dehydrogenase family)
MQIQFKEKVTIISGATSGIGKAAAKIFSDSGAHLMLTGRRIEVLKELHTDLKIRSNKVSYLAGDLSDSDFRRALIDNTIREFEKLDILINAAGIIGMGTIESTSLDNFDKMMSINLRSVFHLIQLAIPHLEKTKGNIVNVSSVAGLRSFPGIFSYCISKAALDQLTRCAALELAPKKIRINAVNPGVVVTNLHKRSGMSDEKYQKFLEHSKSTHPIGRVGNAEEIAKLIAFIASEDAGWITGATHSIDGGRAQTSAR